MPESESERWKRNFHELLQELRVVQTGNQILFAFLLTVAFTNRFTEATPLQRGVYVGVLIAAAAATALIIAPVSFHRFLFRRGAKPQIVQMASALAMMSLFCIMIAMSGALFLAVDFVVGRAWAASVAAIIAVLHLCLWYVLPLMRKWRMR